MIPPLIGSGIEGIWNAAGGASLVGFIWLYLNHRKMQNQHAVDGRKADLDLEQHRDQLTFDLLKAAQSEIKALRLDRERFNDLHIQHFEDALGHIEALLLVENNADRKAAERQARAFLNRMRRLAEVRGVIANEVQRLESERNLGGDGKGAE